MCKIINIRCKHIWKYLCDPRIYTWFVWYIFFFLSVIATLDSTSCTFVFNSLIVLAYSLAPLPLSFATSLHWRLIIIVENSWCYTNFIIYFLVLFRLFYLSTWFLRLLSTESSYSFHLASEFIVSCSFFGCKLQL